ncbi:HesB/YadR/YfhF family protein [Listeria costaricensis]|uniref:HesB/YadR/YfhF family protein n=1 Tax=Listeria costaricensis TaxID=2026604 RepID=UPI000C079579|nr:HesB/YadR/YfhF family protein [Listeria costaricensis]
MKIDVTENAQKWFKDEFDVSGDNGIRLFAKYGGSNSSLHPGFSIGLAAEVPTEIAVSDEEENLLIFVEEHDYWYFKEHDWQIDYDPETEEVKFSYSEAVK